MGRAESVLGAVVQRNNDRMQRRATDHEAPNPRDLTGVVWNDRLEASHEVIAAEWDRFVARGGELPHIGDVIGEDQGNEGAWRAGILISRGRPATDLAHRFPRTIAALAPVPGLWSALWSVLEPGTELPEHCGPNAGMLRYHLGIRCGTQSALRVDGRTVAYEDGRGLLFDDTVPHSAWNHGTQRRITLFCELVRPAPGWVGLANRAMQSTISLDRRYRRAPGRADEWDRALNARQPD